MQTNEPINTIPIQQFIQVVKTGNEMVYYSFIHA
jgi:hypothetical protein